MSFEVKFERGFDKLEDLLQPQGLPAVVARVQEEFLNEISQLIFDRIQQFIETADSRGLEDLSEVWVKDKIARHLDERTWRATGAMLENLKRVVSSGIATVGWDDTPHPDSGQPMAQIAEALELGVDSIGIPERPLLRPAAHEALKEAPAILRRILLKHLKEAFK